MKSFKIAIVGLGNVGQAFLSLCLEQAARLREQHNIRLMLVGVADTSGIAVSAYGLKPQAVLQAKAEGKRVAELEEGTYCTSDSFAWRFKSAEANLIIETLPSNLSDGQPALDVLEHAISERMHVITANKGAVLHSLRKLEMAAEDEGVGFGYSATTGGALPSVSFGWRELAGAQIEEIAGILNGTTNYILSEMDTGKSYEEALVEAQAAGVAEPDPTQDVEGLDTAAKLVIIANKLMGVDARLEDVERRGIVNLGEFLELDEMRQEGVVPRLIGRATRVEEGVKLKVMPEAVYPDEPFFHVRGTSKAITYRTDTLGEFMLVEHNSSRLTTAAAMLKDLIHIAREHA